MAKYRILSFDGGGIRGLLSLILLQRLEKELPDWLDKADLLAGTSTGGIIALALAHGVTVAELRRLYEERGKLVFDDSWWDDLCDLGKTRGADYKTKNLETEVRRLLGNTRLKDLKKRVLIPAFDLDNEKPEERCWAPKFFNNFPGEDSDGEQLAYKVALYTSAAPTYFPSVDGYIDGGVAANNPSMAALAVTQDHRAFGKNSPDHNEIALLSIGTGKSLVRIEGKNLDWGYAQWARPIIDMMLDGVMGVADYQCRQILGANYFRLAPVFPPDMVIPFDGVKRIPELVEFAENVDVSKTVEWLKTVWK